MLVGLYPLHQHHPTNHPWWSPLPDSQLVLVRLPDLLLLVPCLLDQVGTRQRSQQRGVQCSGYEVRVAGLVSTALSHRRVD